MTQWISSPGPEPRPATPPEAPPVAHEVVAIVRDVLGEGLIGAYLHGSAVLGGLRPTSDIDVLAVIGRPTTEPERRALVDRLLEISGRRARRGPGRPIELTILVQSDVRPWRHPPRVEFLYGEWRRDDYERGCVPAPEPMVDLGPEITLTLAGNLVLAGPPPAEVLDPIPEADLRRAITAGVPSLMDDLDFGHAQRPAHAGPDLGDARDRRDQHQGPGRRMGARAGAGRPRGTAESRSRDVPRGLGSRRLGR